MRAITCLSASRHCVYQGVFLVGFSSSWTLWTASLSQFRLGWWHCISSKFCYSKRFIVFEIWLSWASIARRRSSWEFSWWLIWGLGWRFGCGLSHSLVDLVGQRCRHRPPQCFWIRRSPLVIFYLLENNGLNSTIVPTRRRQLLVHDHACWVPDAGVMQKNQRLEWHISGESRTTSDA